jgi:repressor LexA
MPPRSQCRTLLPGPSTIPERQIRTRDFSSTQVFSADEPLGTSALHAPRQCSKGLSGSGRTVQEHPVNARSICYIPYIPTRQGLHGLPFDGGTTVGEQVFAFLPFAYYADEHLFVRSAMSEPLSPIRQKILDFIVSTSNERKFPPSIREICAHVGLSSPASVQRHINQLKVDGYITSNDNQSRTITVKHLPGAPEVSTNRTIPLIGDVAAGTGTLAEASRDDMMSLPEEFAGRGDSFVLRVRGESMIDDGILPGDYVVVARQSEANIGEIVVAGIHDGEATVKRYFPQGAITVLQPANASMEPMSFPSNDVVIYGRVISVLRRY